MQATAVVYVALLVVAGCNAADEPVEVEEDDLVEETKAAELEDAAGVAGAELVKESRLGAKVAPRSRFPAAMVGYNRYYPGYSPEYYYPPNYPSYYPSYPNNYYPPVVYPTSNYPPPINYPTNNFYPPYNPYEYPPYGGGVNEYSARHERA